MAAGVYVGGGDRERERERVLIDILGALLF